jgi:hypothetical protein
MSKRFDASEIELPPQINKDAWMHWCEDRKERRKPLTQRAAIMTINKLVQFSHAEQASAVMESIMHGWTGLFPKRSTGFVERITNRDWAADL